MKTSRRSLVLITADSLRASHCGFQGYDRQTTPSLDELAPESWVFSNAVVAGTPTYNSLPAILASRYPLALGRDVVGIAPGEATLASALSAVGYKTACFSAANPYLSRQFGYDQGFETFEDFLDEEKDLPASTAIGGTQKLRSRMNRSLAQLSSKAGLTAIYDELYFQYCQQLAAESVRSYDSLRPFPSSAELMDGACEWLSSIGQDSFFLWLHLMDTHSPYYPSENSVSAMGVNASPSRARYLNACWNRDVQPKKLTRKRRKIVGLYDACIRTIDSQISRLIDALRQHGLWKECVFAFTADHGEEFLEHGGRYHAPSKLTEELVHVPLIIRVPDSPPVVAKSPFSLLHLAPTLLAAVGVGAPASFTGTSHYQQASRAEPWDTPVLTECIRNCKNPFRAQARMGARLLAVRKGQYKLVVDLSGRKEELFDLKSDPGERWPLPVQSERQVRRRLLEIAHKHIMSSKAQPKTHFRLTSLLREARHVQ